MSEHLSADDLRYYEQGKADPAVLLSWDDHLSECPMCRGRLAPVDALGAWASGLANDNSEDSAAHLTYEQLVTRAENRVADADRFAIEYHLKTCTACTEELADLNRFRATPGVLPQAKQRARIWPWLAVAAAAVMIVGGTIVALTRHPRPPAPVAAVNIPAGWPAADRALVEEALRSGHLPLAPRPSDLLSREGQLLGPSSADPFALLAPLGAIVESDRPEFRWQPVDRATSYRVEIYDVRFHPVLRSPELSKTEWTPARPLPRGEFYRWQIVADIGGARISVPSPPSPAAVFRILDSATEARVEGARATGPMGHLLAAAILAQAGIEAESRKELDFLPAETRGLPQVQKLTR